MNFPMRAEKVPIWHFHRTRLSEVRSQLIGNVGEKMLNSICFIKSKQNSKTFSSAKKLKNQTPDVLFSKKVSIQK